MGKKYVVVALDFIAVVNLYKSTSSRETLRLSGKHQTPREQTLSVYYYLISTLKLEESTITMEICPVTSILELFECAMRFRSTFKYATADLTGISKSSSIKKARLFESKLLCSNILKRVELLFVLQD